MTRGYLSVVLWCASIVCTTVAAPAAETLRRPNFLVILCDDLGYGDLACYGHPTIRTPNLDGLARQGMRLTACCAAAPVCSPSRAGLLTGRTPSRVGVYDWIPAGNAMHLRREEITVATLLRRAGYATAHVGKWHLNGRFNRAEQPQPNDHGFEYWCSTQNNAAPTHYSPRNFVRNGRPVGRTEGYSCQIVADEAIHWLRENRDRTKPFFAFVCFHEPHEPIDSPPELVEKYESAGATKRGQALYYANVENMDAAVGKLVRALDELQLADGTLVFFTSDNGPETLSRYAGAWRSHGSPGPLRGMKLWLYEGGIRVPGILRWPGRIRPGQVVGEPICGLDVLPTLCELAGVDAPTDRTIDGSSITALLEGKPFRRPKPLYWHYFNAIGPPKAAMRIGDWMVLARWDQPESSAGGGFQSGSMAAIKNGKLTGFELYNLRTDPVQQKDLATEEPERLRELSEKLQKRYAEVQAEGPVWSE